LQGIRNSSLITPKIFIMEESILLQLADYLKTRKAQLKEQSNIIDKELTVINRFLGHFEVNETPDIDWKPLILQVMKGKGALTKLMIEKELDKELKKKFPKVNYSHQSLLNEIASVVVQNRAFRRPKPGWWELKE
jgi:hypothetical protein